MDAIGAKENTAKRISIKLFFILFIMRYVDGVSAIGLYIPTQISFDFV